MLRTAWLVAAKDLRIELRSRVLLWQVLPFGVMALLLCGLALGPDHAGSSSSAPGLFYLVLVLVTLLVINRSQSIEQVPGTQSSVATLGLDPAGVFLGKAGALCVELWATAGVLLCGSVLFLHIPLHAALGSLPSIVVTTGALAGAGSLYGALVTGNNGAATLLPVLSLPAFSPLLIAGERSFSAALNHGSIWQWWVISLISLVAYTAVGILLYGVMEES